MRRDDARLVARCPSRSSVSAACRIVSQSDWLPMMMPMSHRASVVMPLPFRPGSAGSAGAGQVSEAASGAEAARPRTPVSLPAPRQRQEVAPDIGFGYNRLQSVTAPFGAAIRQATSRGSTMEILVTLVLFYLAIGAACSRIRRARRCPTISIGAARSACSAPPCRKCWPGR